MTAATRTAVEPPLPAGTRPVPGYEILGHLDRTGWLDLYDSWSEERTCRCVIKVLRPDLRGHPGLGARLLREGGWLRDFTHPHLARAYETFTEPEPLVVMETLTGETLAHLLGRLRRRPGATDVALLGVQLCSAVYYLHGRGLLHLDLKPANIVVDRGHVKVLDLSVARPPGYAPRGTGTLYYRSPEQARGGPLSAAADVWGIGVTLYETACGDVPFPEGEEDGSEDSAGGVRCPLLEEAAPPVASRRRLPRTLAGVVDACLSLDPANRPALPGLAEALGTVLPSP
ncbi:serine/threonine-protein kinase [Streptomyces sp. NPDC088337]|uniref:serine/threonine-protein kinase n=1 Tax=unclassified Streptomyces TaxID=2593676 RepID=UPI0038215AF4